MNSLPSEKQDSLLPYEPVNITGRTVAVAIEASNIDHDSPAKITASGRGKLAEQILQIAFSRGIKVRTDADLAELLATLELDSPIPSEAIVAVAEILAKVYEVNAAMAGPIENPKEAEG